MLNFKESESGSKRNSCKTYGNFQIWTSSRYREGEGTRFPQFQEVLPCTLTTKPSGSFIKVKKCSTGEKWKYTWFGVEKEWRDTFKFQSLFLPSPPAPGWFPSAARRFLPDPVSSSPSNTIRGPPHPRLRSREQLPPCKEKPWTQVSQNIPAADSAVLRAQSEPALRHSGDCSSRVPIG